METFSQKVKEQLSAIEIKKKCCRYTESAMKALSKNADNSSILAEIWQKCRCEGCRAVYFSSLFVLYGSVTNPEKQYHLDFSFKNAGEADAVEEALGDQGFEFHRSTRRERHVLYVKNSTAIEDFLVFAGASGAAFDLMNSKIVRDFRNSVNRQVNCDTANIEKQLDAVRRYTDAISYLVKTKKIDSLTPDLKQTALLRLENEQLSLVDLGNLFNPPVSKSGVKHRLERIMELAYKLGYVPEKKTGDEDTEREI